MPTVLRFSLKKNTTCNLHPSHQLMFPQEVFLYQVFEVEHKLSDGAPHHFSVTNPSSLALVPFLFFFFLLVLESPTGQRSPWFVHGTDPLALQNDLNSVAICSLVTFAALKLFFFLNQNILTNKKGIFFSWRSRSCRSGLAASFLSAVPPTQWLTTCQGDGGKFTESTRFLGSWWKIYPAGPPVNAPPRAVATGELALVVLPTPSLTPRHRSLTRLSIFMVHLESWFSAGSQHE